MIKADLVLDWLVNAENRGGGISAWKDASHNWHRSYPEVTGYLIPTMRVYGLDALAKRCADWLVGIQNADGSFPGLDGKPRGFDTAAVMEGLRSERKTAAYNRALAWMKTQARDDGTLRISPDVDETRVYMLRAASIAGMPVLRGALANWEQPERTHYIAYALEGAWRAGMWDAVRGYLDQSRAAIRPDGLMPAYVGAGFSGATGSDTCATAQFAMLYRWAGMDAERLLVGVERMIEPNGGVRHDNEDNREIAWAAKFYLDALKAQAE
jgi:hypothetical protein